MQLELFDKPIKKIAESTRKCKNCGEVHPLTEEFFGIRNRVHFSRADSLTVYHRHTCKTCDSKMGGEVRFLRKKHIAEKGDTCSCCGKKVSQHSRGYNSLVLDHCHVTGRFRGWICSDCNVGIGRMGDSVEGLQKAINYLKACDERS
jgi:hypothetical protein